MKCSKCGAEYEGNFCSNCGANIFRNVEVAIPDKALALQQKTAKGCLIAILFPIILIISLIILFTVQSHTPEQLGKYGEVYKSSNEDIDGSNSVINVTNIYKKGNNIIIDVGAPTADQIAWAYKKFMFFDALDDHGKSIKIGQISMSKPDNNENVEMEFTLKCDDYSKCKYIKIGTYKMSNGDILTFELK
jgi:hypothetical protein